jgi:membrane-associated phospholipid phosphatase
MTVGWGPLSWRWPLLGLAGLVVLGLVVGRGPTPLDAVFTHAGRTHHVLRNLLWCTDPRVQVVLWLAVLCGALVRRRWRLAAIVVGAPVLALVAEQLAKRVFGRLKGDSLSYPSGHVTLLVTTLGLGLLVAGFATWLVVTAAVWTLLGLLGQSFTYHYFTDTIGALCLGGTVVWLAARLDTCQPRCDPRHSDG